MRTPTQTPPRPQQRSPTEAPSSIHDVVNEINQYSVRDSMALALHIGNCVLGAFFNDDPAAYFDPSGEQRTSLKELTSHPKLKIARSTLSNYIRVACQVREFPERLGLNLTMTQHRSLLLLPKMATRIELGRQAWQGEWSEERLDTEVRSRLPASRRKRNAPAARLLIKRMERTIDGRLLAALHDGTRAQPDEDERASLLRRLGEVQAAMDQLRAALLEAAPAPGGPAGAFTP